MIANSESESDENVEDLLSEYQHYLDKAHDQRRIYFEKLNQTKNKVPLLRRESFVKTHVPTYDKYNEYYNTNSYYNPSIFKLPPTTFTSPLDLFIPLTQPLKYFNGQSSIVQDTMYPKRVIEDLPSADKVPIDKKPLTLPPLLRKPVDEPVKSSCICPSNQIPCKCNCKQCLIRSSTTPNNNNQLKSQYPDNNRNILLTQNPFEHLIDDMSNTANTVNVKIKVDIQLPKNLEALGNYNNQQHNRDSTLEYEDMSKELTSNIRLPTTSFNFPIPLNMFGYKRAPKIINRHESSPFRKITIHKKKKSRISANNNKRHRKKLISFHNVNVAPSQTTKPILNEIHNLSVSDKKTEFSNGTRRMNVTENTTKNLLETSNYTTTTTEISLLKNTTQYEDSIFFMVNISHSNDKDTEDVHKTLNNVRKKRELSAVMKNNSSLVQNTSNIILKQDKPCHKDTKVISNVKKPEKILFSDSDFLYWPNSSQNATFLKAKNITDIILERENKKAKLNISKETIRQNRTVALEQAIFGHVNWTDIDTVAPTFISFVGKYINGILTLCSQKICHSMKCAEKTCIHRTCLPEQRFNHIGHCSGSNKTGKYTEKKINQTI